VQFEAWGWVVGNKIGNIHHQGRSIPHLAPDGRINCRTPPRQHARVQEWARGRRNVGETSTPCVRR